MEYVNFFYNEKKENRRSISSKKNRPDKPHGRERWRLFSLLLTFMLLSVSQSWADLGKHEKATVYSVNNTEGYVEFRIPIYTGEGVDTWAKSGSYLYIGSNESAIFYFKTTTTGDDDRKWYKFMIKPSTGWAGRISVRHYTSENSSSQIYTDKQAMFDETWSQEYRAETSSTGHSWMYVRVYPKSLLNYFGVYYDAERTGINKDYTYKQGIATSQITPPTYTDMSFNSSFEVVTGSPLKVNITSTPKEKKTGIRKVSTDGGKTKVNLTDQNYKITFEKTLNESNFNRNTTHDVKYYWVQNVEDRLNPLEKHVKTHNVLIPAFNQPRVDSFTGVYDQSTGNITLNWTIDASSHSNTKNFIDGGEFVIERSTENTFSKNGSTYKNYTVDFKKDTVNYSFSDDIASISNNKKFYYRIVRTVSKIGWSDPSSNPNWPTNVQYYQLAPVVDVDAPVAHVSVKEESVKVSLEGNCVKLNWELNPGYWSSNTTLEIVKYNETTRSQVGTTIINNVNEIKAGEYIEQNPIPSCNAFSYKLQIKPGPGSIFIAENPVSGDQEALIVEVGTIHDFVASKGYYSDKTELRWKTTGAFDEFVIKRFEIGAIDTLQIGTVPATISTDYLWDDNSGIAGTYYEYFIHGVISCNNEPMEGHEALKSVGFRTPTGNVYGRVAYKNGQSVEDVSILLEAGNIDLGYSMLLSENTLMSAPLTKELLSNDAFSFQIWFKATGEKPSNQTLFYTKDQYEIGFDGSGYLFFGVGQDDTKEMLKGEYVFNSDTYYHISVVKNANKIFLYVNGDLDVSKTLSGDASADIDTFYIGSYQSDAGSIKHFIGNVEELRLWNRALEEKEIERDYDRFIIGDENKLIAYYRFNEMIENAFYDQSFVKTKYNENHGVIANGTRSEDLPENLGLKGMTDSSGDYFINGVPYIGNGTQYTITPQKGDHQFDPPSTPKNIGNNNTSVQANFTDISSYTVEGVIYYEGTNIPVQDVTFKIDGIAVDDGRGGLAITNAKGEFSINVPSGEHEVKAIKQGHVFNNDGRLLVDGKDIFYEKHMSDVRIWDETKVRWIGRVAGGAVQESYPVGHSLSKNNLGDSPIIILKAEDSSIKFLTKEAEGDPARIERDTIPHFLSANRRDMKPTQTVMVTKEDAIYIYPDEETGEFYVDLIPFRFKLDSVATEGHKNDIIKKQTDVANILDLQNSVNQMEEIYAYVDSLPDGLGGMDYFQYSDTVFYHHKEQFIKRVKTEIDFYQLNGGTRVDYMGESEMEFSNLFDESFTIPIYVNGKYTFEDENKIGIPAYLQGKQYIYVAQAFEGYRYNGSTAPSLLDRVPTVDGTLIVTNNLAVADEVNMSIPLDDTGMALYAFTADLPDMGATGTKNFSARIKLSNNQQDAWLFEGKTETMKAYTIGSRSRGSDFVTNGPNQLITVLRDPPGSRSYAYLEKGTVITSTKTTKEGVKQSGEHDIRAAMGAEYKAAAGTPFFMQVTEIKTENSVGGIVSHEQSSFDGNTKTSKTTLMTRFQTSEDPLYVGRDGDVLIGNSTNMVYGVCDMYLMMEAESPAAKKDDEIIATSSDKKYKLVRRKSYNSDVQFNTMFAYPQVHIENRLIPELIGLKNSFLQYGPEWTPVNAQSYADANNEIVYVSKLSPDHENFGCSNNDDEVFGEKSNGSIFLEDGPSYTMYLPKNMEKKEQNDTIFSLNQSVKNWYNLLSQNEQAKLRAQKLHSNYSFHAGSQIEYSEEYSFETANTYEYEYFVGAQAVLELGFLFNGFGFKTSFKEGGYDQGVEETSDSDEYTRKEGFVLAEEGDDDYLSVDVFYETSEYKKYESGPNENLDKMLKGPFVYRTRGGVTCCPYEGARYTKYYQPGTLLDEATVQLEVPVLKVEPASVANVPQSRPAVFRLTLENQSEANEDVYFVLQVLDGTNPNGAKLSIDGQPFSNTGRAFLLPYGTPLVKTLEVRPGADSMRYENIQLILRSQCQYDPTGFQETIADTISISAYFVPGCSDINIKTPLENFIVNTKSEIKDGAYQLPVILDGYDVNNMSLDRIELQMKQEDESQWLIMHTFHTDPDKVINPKTESIFDRTKAEIEYSLPMERYDSRYQLRAVTYCHDSGEEIPTASAVITGTKDVERAKLFGSPQPANGILDVEGNIQLIFNETIKEGALSRYNFQVTGIKNGSNTNHGASIEFDGVNDYLATEAERNLVDKDLTIETWVYRANGDGAGTLFSFGNPNKSLDFGFTADDKLMVQYNGTTVTSNTLPVQPGTSWAHVAMVYEAEYGTVSLYYNAVRVSDFKLLGTIDAVGHFEFGRSLSGSNYYKGKMHETRIWSKQLTATDLQANRLRIYSGSESGLLAYYPMAECKGNVVFDKAMGANAAMYANWSTQESYAVDFDGDAIVTVPSVEFTEDMDYTVELWFKAEPGQTNTTLISNEINQTANIPGITNENRFFLGFNDNGQLLFRSNTREEVITNKDGDDYRDNNWHHVALSLNRVTRRAEAFVDGNLIVQFSIYDMDGMSADAVSIGGIRIFDNVTVTGIEKGFKGSIDEVRFWNSALTEDIINNLNNTRLNGDEMGLAAYYPFEKYKTENGITSLSYSLDNQAINDEAIGQEGTANKAKSTALTAPIKDRGPVENISYSFVVSDKSIIIYLDEDMDVIEKSTITFSVKEVQDMFGNETLSPIIWSAYIDRNLLKWSENEVSLRKDEYAPLEFKVDIQNTGGMIERFTLENLPVWLTATPMAGTVAPKAKQTITFVINEGVNVGRYDEVIYMKNSKNVSEQLALNLIVGGDVPDWKVNPGDYEQSMSVFGKLRVEGVFSSDKEDMIAAFIDGRCVGVVNNIYQSKTNTWYTFLTVYGNKEDAGAEIEFRIWDSSMGKTYAATTTQDIQFKNEAISGTSETPLIFDTSELVFQNMKLNQGWNWISLQVDNSRLSDVTYMLQNAAWSSNDIVKDENNFDSYSTNAKEWFGTLSQNGGFTNTSLYMIKSSDAQVLSVNGRLVNPKTMPIAVKGNNRWNYISYLPAANMNIDEALSDYPAQSGDVIKSQEGFAMFDGYTWIGSLSYLEPNKGYMLLRTATSDVTFTYPTISGSLSTKSGGDMTNNFCYQNYDHANNMTLTAVVDNQFDLRKGDRLIAIIDNEVRGMSEVKRGQSSELHFINVVSDEPGVVRFVIEREGKIIAAASNTFDYVVNKVKGSLEEPVVLDFSKQQTISLYPNPFTTHLNIAFELEKGAEVEIIVNDMAGRLIHKWNKQSYGAGNHVVVWNAPQVSTTGIYLVTIVIDGEISSHKVIKTN